MYHAVILLCYSEENMHIHVLTFIFTQSLKALQHQLVKKKTKNTFESGLPRFQRVENNMQNSVQLLLFLQH